MVKKSKREPDVFLEDKTQFSFTSRVHEIVYVYNQK